MNVTITPGKLSGSIKAVSSKSDAHRKIICSALCDEPTEIYIRGVSRDIGATLGCIKALGAKVNKKSNSIIVSKGLAPKNCTLDCGESGTTARFLLPVAACIAGKFTMRGEGRLPDRPFTELVREMRKKGCDITGETVPLTVSGRLLPGEYKLEGDISSQYISGLMLALPALNADSRITLLSPLESSAYVDMTIDTLSLFGVKIERTEYGFYIKGNQKLKSPKCIECDGDWSNAAFFLAMKECGCDVTVSGISEASKQGDKVFSSAAKLSEVDVSGIPDLVPPLAVAAAGKCCKTVFENAGRLRLKESDRLVSVSEMINSLGGHAEISGDNLIIYGSGRLSGGTVNSYSDHRIVMAAAAASVISDGKITILGAEAADKSYPSFFDDFKAIGGELDVEY